MTLATYLDTFRAARGYGFSEAARMAGIDRSTLFRWETGKRLPSYDALRALCDAYGATVLEYERAEECRRSDVRARELARAAL